MDPLVYASSEHPGDTHTVPKDLCNGVDVWDLFPKMLLYGFCCPRCEVDAGYNRQSWNVLRGSGPLGVIQAQRPVRQGGDFGKSSWVRIVL